MKNLPIGKTIASIIRTKKPEYDDTGWLKFVFTDGSYSVVWAGYKSWTGESEDEYPTCIGFRDNDEGLVPCEN